MATLFEGVELVNAKGEVARGETVLAGKVVALYFSAEWCPYCREFEPALNAFYEQVNKDQARFEIVFVSSDNSADEQRAHFAAHHGTWWAVPRDNPLRQQLKVKYEVAARKELAHVGLTDRKGGLPTLLVITPTGEAIDYEGTEKVSKLGVDALAQWEAKVEEP